MAKFISIVIAYEWPKLCILAISAKTNLTTIAYIDILSSIFQYTVFFVFILKHERGIQVSTYIILDM